MDNVRKTTKKRGIQERFLPTAEILQILNTSKGYLDNFITRGCPGAGGKGRGYPLYAICKWIIGKPVLKKDRTNIREIAAGILKEAGIPLSVDKPKAETPKVEPSLPKAAKGKSGELGLEAALSRIKAMEEFQHARLMESIETDSVDHSTRFRDWQSSLEILRKMEADTLKVLEEQKRLVPVDKVTAWLSRKIETTKAFLLNLPGKVAPNLDGLPWHEIQKRLDAEVRNALTQLSTNDLV